MDDAEYLTMSAKELNRLEVLRRVLERRLTQAQAAEQLRLGTRQDRRGAVGPSGAATAGVTRRSSSKARNGKRWPS